jgi:hypothetical protein
VLQTQNDVSGWRLRPHRRQLRRIALLRFADDVLLLSTRYFAGTLAAGYQSRLSTRAHDTFARARPHSVVYGDACNSAVISMTV